MIRLKQLLLETHSGKRLIEAGEATPATTYEFQDSFPDNIVLPIKPKQPDITSFDKITSVNQLTPSLQNFINTLNAAVKTKKISAGTIPITSEASAGTKATKLIPGGDTGDWTQAQVDFSYSNGAQMTNQTLADRRAEGIEYVIKKFVKLPPEVKITKTGNGNGTKKSARAVVPIQTYSKTSPAAVINKGGQKETFDLAAKKYTPPAYTDAKIQVIDCGKSLDANGMAGNPIAFRSKLEVTSGTLTVNFDSYYVPDRLVILKMDKGQGTPKVLHDTGYLSSDPTSALLDFGKVLDDLNKTVKNGYDGTIKQPTPVTLNLGDEDGSIYYVEVYAPLGPTLWNMSIACNIGGEVTTITLQNISTPEIQAILNKKNSKVDIEGTHNKNQIIYSSDHPGEYIMAGANDTKSTNPNAAELTKFIQTISKSYNVDLNTLVYDANPKAKTDPKNWYLTIKPGLVQQILGNDLTIVENFLTNKTLADGKKAPDVTWNVSVANTWLWLSFENGKLVSPQSFYNPWIKNRFLDDMRTKLK
jgi:hypothetical protein